VTGDQSQPSTGRAPFRVGDWLVEPDLDRISSGVELVVLRPRVTELLVCLARCGDRLASTRHLIDSVWGTEFVTVNALTQLVAELRRALGDDPAKPRYVETIPRRGYRLIAPTTMTELGQQPEIEGELIVELVDDEGTEWLLEPGETVIGRSPDAAVRIDRSEISRRHARIAIEGRTVTLEDLGSKNGTCLRGRRLDGVVELENSDEIQLGADLARFRVKIHDARTKTEHDQS
jgi:DNA-binding winged helix-turn-helix (wHTH) protein